MCIISLCVAKAQQGKGAQMYSPTGNVLKLLTLWRNLETDLQREKGDIPGRTSRNYIRNVEIERTTKEIDFGVKSGPPGHMVEFKPNYEDAAPRKSSKSRYVSFLWCFETSNKSVEFFETLFSGW